MRLTFVNYTSLPGLDDPAELLRRLTLLGTWARAVAAAGGDDVTVSVVQRFARDARLHEDGIAYHFVADGPVQAQTDRLWAPRLVERVASLEPDVVHLHGLVPLPARQLRSRLAPATALVAQDHGGAYEHPGFRKWRWRTFNRLGLRAADGFLFSARALSRPWIDAGVIGPGQPIYEILEGSSTLPYRPPAVEGRSLPGAPALLWVGRLNANKDPLTIIRGFERALPALPGAELTLAFGEADLRPEVERRIAGSRLAGRVHLRGRVPHDQLPALYASADLFVLGSRSESLCFSLVEALSFGVVPVVSDIPPFRALTGGGRVGALFPAGDAEALAGALIRLGAAPPDRAAVRAHFEATLSWPVLGRRALAIYEEAAQLRAASAGAPRPAARSRGGGEAWAHGGRGTLDG